MKPLLPTETTYQHLSDLINPQATAHSVYQVNNTIQLSGSQPSSDTIRVTQMPSGTGLFTSHQLPVKQEGKPMTHTSTASDWMFIVLFLSLALMALIRMIYTRKLRILFLSPFSTRYMSLIIRDNDILTPTLRFYLLVNYLAMASLAIYLLANHFITLPDRPFTNGFLLYTLIFGTLAILYIVRIWLATFWGHLF
ncbi:MAG: hypothetical protein CVU06_12570, partial [Bacteroidetes bacterium HGW-Bacteroidetes-22]